MKTFLKFALLPCLVSLLLFDNLAMGKRVEDLEPGDRYWLGPGDVIVEVNGESIGNWRDLPNAVSRSPQTMKFTVRHPRGVYIELETTFAPEGERFGVNVNNAPGGGARVTSVTPNSPATRCTVISVGVPVGPGRNQRIQPQQYRSTPPQVQPRISYQPPQQSPPQDSRGAYVQPTSQVQSSTVRPQHVNALEATTEPTQEQPTSQVQPQVSHVNALMANQSPSQDQTPEVNPEPAQVRPNSEPRQRERYTITPPEGRWNTPDSRPTRMIVVRGNLSQVREALPALGQGLRLGVGVVNHPGGGVRVTDVLPDGPGDRAGFTAGIVILEINGTPIRHLQDYSNAIDHSPETMEAKGVNTNDGQEFSITVELEN